MKIWQLLPSADVKESNDPWSSRYDCYYGFVIAAETEEQARQMAQAESYRTCACETQTWIDQDGSDVAVERQVWTDPRFTTCVELTAGNEPRIIEASYHAG